VINEEEETAFQIDEKEVGQIDPDDPRFDHNEYTWLLGEKIVELEGEEETQNTTDISSEEFDHILVEIVRETDPVTLLRVPGVYEILAEEFNNEVLERWEKEYS